MSARFKTTLLTLLLIAASFIFFVSLKNLLLNSDFVLSLSFDSYQPLIYLIFSLYFFSLSNALLVWTSPAIRPKLIVFTLASLTSLAVFQDIALSLVLSVFLFLILILSGWGIINRLRTLLSLNSKSVLSTSLYVFFSLLNLYVSVIFFFVYSLQLSKSGTDLNQKILGSTDVLKWQKVASDLIPLFGFKVASVDVQEPLTGFKSANIAVKEDYRDEQSNDALNLPLFSSIIIFLILEFSAGILFALFPVLHFLGTFIAKISGFTNLRQKEVERFVEEAKNKNFPLTRGTSNKKLRDWIN